MSDTTDLTTTDWRTQTIAWDRTEDGEFPYAAESAGRVLVVRVNDWPDAPSIYTLFVDDAEDHDFDDWPATWMRPGDDAATEGAELGTDDEGTED